MFPFNISADSFSLLYLALRIHPVLPCNSRIAARDTVIPAGSGPDGRCPVFVQKGTMIAYYVTALHRRKDLWGEDADEYCPERWKDGKLSWVSEKFFFFLLVAFKLLRPC